jgi:hypothetical protein
MKKTDDRESPTGISDSHNSTTVIFDSWKVRAGALSPAFPPTRSAPADGGDTSKARMGAVTPAFPPTRSSPATATDASKVQMGAVSPAFPPLRPQ